MLTLIKNARVFAPQSLGLQHLLIAAGKILQISRALPQFPSGVDIAEVDLEGKRLIPGFIDGHAHVTGGGGESGFASRVPAVGLSRFTRAGITSVVGLLGTDDTTRNTTGLLAETRSLREQGLNAWCYTGGYHLPAVTLTGSVRSDIVHLDPVIGVGEVAISDHRSSQPTLDELLRVASETHVAGMITGKAGILHLHLGDGERGLDLVRQALAQSEIPARVFNPTHINRRKALFEEACEVATQGCCVDITAFPVAEDEDAWSATEALSRYWQSGAPAAQITVSSDGGGCLPHFDRDGNIVHMDIGDPASLADTLAELLDNGVSLEQALPAFTSNVARLLRLHHKGTVAAGQDADLLVLDERHHIDSVMINGIWHRKNHAQLIVGNFESTSEKDSS
ncbi:MAG: beta-aspartyl-peptidase [Gammaproteobacteria bacterium]|nr:beta-aspartyl-peptidase [Gammaproteobacteria bacterium]